LEPSGKVALHFSPHPDDELVAAPATLMALRDAGWRVVNVACSLGGAGQRARREAEMREACRRAGFELCVPGKPGSISPGVDPPAAQAELTDLAAEALARAAPALVLSPGPGDLHHSHLVVFRAVRDAIASRGPEAPRWWMWALWGSLPQPTLGTAFGEDRLEEVLAALGAYESELARNDYRRLVRARAEASAVLAPELLFGFGSTADAKTGYAELLTEAALSGARWLLGRPRWLDVEAPLCDPPAGADTVKMKPIA
jgi:LmbE family N-acetylglucosaminyl deacetylase